jgi:twitching motility protein PilT
MVSKQLLNTILEFASKQAYPDIHLNTWFLPKIRDINGNIENLTSINTSKKVTDEVSLEKKVIEETIQMPILTKELIREIIIAIVWENWYENFELMMELDTSYSINKWDRYRVNCYMDSAWYSVALRIIPSKIPTLEELGLWDTVKEMCNKWKWLIIVTWPTGAWKSTNLAAMIDYINKNHKKHIITIEDPVEFTFTSDKCLINQREVWHHTKGFDIAMRSVLREDPDIIMVWEMRDPETIKTAITLAETWHLVLSTLHTNDSVQAIDRIVDVFPGSQQKQIRMQLAMSLTWVISQRLIARKDREWRIAAREILISTDAVRNLIITWKTHQLYSVLEVWMKYWMILMDKYLILLYKKWVISRENLLSYARDKDGVEMLIEN